ncbi:hypothetical protein K2173_014231 [Erythroxylum novogranatense]|uniref:ATP synthase protein MI25 n=1 Tax=Erythroxylum novogranatense TaxID=1862640 RepID=A0AAV8SE78_9ROSI|nr:hypothetical protein K2173_014231 [Erythroxylum novogranatense]
MECKKKGSETAANGMDHEDVNCMHSIALAAGAALAMACFKGITATFVMEKWRSTVFLVLNIIVLAICFSTIHDTPTKDEEGSSRVELKMEKMEKRAPSEKSSKVELASKEFQESCKRAIGEPEQEQDTLRINSSEHIKLSKEELNERVEAFITMFRQHLASDARIGRKQFLPRPNKQSEMVYCLKKSNLNLRSQGIRVLSI